jgi:hypothetical protein
VTCVYDPEFLAANGWLGFNLKRVEVHIFVHHRFTSPSVKLIVKSGLLALATLNRPQTPSINLD